MSLPQQRQWADTVMASLTSHLAGMCTIAMLADTAYRQLLIPELHIQDIEILMPMEGLSQGRQLQ